MRGLTTLWVRWMAGDLACEELPSLFLHADSASPDEGDSESVCSSQDGSVMSEEGMGAGPVGGGAKEEGSEEDLQFLLSEHIDQLGDKR